MRERTAEILNVPPPLRPFVPLGEAGGADGRSFDGHTLRAVHSSSHDVISFAAYPNADGADRNVKASGIARHESALPKVHTKTWACTFPFVPLSLRPCSLGRDDGSWVFFFRAIGFRPVACRSAGILLWT